VSAPDFEAFAGLICAAFFEAAAEVDYDTFLEAALATAVVREEVCDPTNPAHAAIADEYEIAPGAPIYVTNFGRKPG